MPLQLREYQKNDFIALKNIIRKTWRYDEFSSPKTASRLADVFLSSCLTNYTFSRVAVLNGKPVGIILVKDIARHTCPLPNRFRQLRAVLSLYLTKEGRAVSKFLKRHGDRQGIAARKRQELSGGACIVCDESLVPRTRRRQSAVSGGSRLYRPTKIRRNLFVHRHKLQLRLLRTPGHAAPLRKGASVPYQRESRFHALFYLRLQTNKKPAR